MPSAARPQPAAVDSCATCDIRDIPVIFVSWPFEWMSRLRTTGKALSLSEGWSFSRRNAGDYSLRSVPSCRPRRTGSFLQAVFFPCASVENLGQVRSPLFWPTDFLSRLVAFVICSLNVNFVSRVHSSSVLPDGLASVDKPETGNFNSLNLIGFLANCVSFFVALFTMMCINVPRSCQPTVVLKIRAPARRSN